jgi:hypothetical protein
MNRRPAVTLLEVLVSIFLMGIGLLSILALFPLGAIRMAQAIQDDRAGHLGMTGLAVAQTFNLRSDTNVTTAFATPGGTPALPPVHPDRPGYPVYLDPIGFQTYLTAQNWVGGTPPPGQTLAIPRRAPNLVYTGGQPDNAKIFRWFTLTDDLRFGTDGTPALLPTTTTFEREGTLSYALMFRQPRSSVPSVVEVSVVVYSRRPLITATTTGGEYPYPATFNPSANLVTLNSAGLTKPPLRAGSWILDATFKQYQPDPNNPNVKYGWAHAYFYRVVSVNEIAPDQFEMEVATPLRRWPAAGGNGTVIVMDNVVEVIERGTGW